MRNIVIIFTIFSLIACNQHVEDKNAKSILEKVDVVVKKLNTKISTDKIIVSIDHHRMAAEEGVYTPPSIVTVFSDPKIEAPLIRSNQLIGLDLPFKVLCYAEPDTTEARVAFTSAEFIRKRHNMGSEALKDYESELNQIVNTFPKNMISNTDVSDVDENFGIVSFKSDFDFSTTIQNLKDMIMGQSDTKWFADVDYKKQASIQNIEVRPTTLLLFGGPAPGGKAMVTSPKIGLDAFCQKLLVYENETGEVWIAYNDIEAFADLYYQSSTKPQKKINERLKVTFTKAINTSLAQFNLTQYHQIETKEDKVKYDSDWAAHLRQTLDTNFFSKYHLPKHDTFLLAYTKKNCIPCVRMEEVLQLYLTSNKLDIYSFYENQKYLDTNFVGNSIGIQEDLASELLCYGTPVLFLFTNGTLCTIFSGGPGIHTTNEEFLARFTTRIASCL